MGTRRIISDEKSLLEKDDRDDRSPSTAEASDTSPAVPAAVIWKMLGFTVSMIVAPIGTYYLTLHNIYKGNSSFAGATAALMANVVLVAYIVVAVREDQSEALAEAEKERKAQ